MSALCFMQLDNNNITQFLWPADVLLRHIYLKSTVFRKHVLICCHPIADSVQEAVFYFSDKLQLLCNAVKQSGTHLTV